MAQMTPEKTEQQAPAEPGDHEKFAHYVPADKLTDAMVFGYPLKALCGKEWIPTRDGLKFTVCPACKDAYDNLKHD